MSVRFLMKWSNQTGGHSIIMNIQWQSVFTIYVSWFVIKEMPFSLSSLGTGLWWIRVSQQCQAAPTELVTRPINYHCKIWNSYHITLHQHQQHFSARMNIFITQHQLQILDEPRWRRREAVFVEMFQCLTDGWELIMLSVCQIII